MSFKEDDWAMLYSAYIKELKIIALFDSLEVFHHGKNQTD
jgi:hypothetical protein